MGGDGGVSMPLWSSACDGWGRRVAINAIAMRFAVVKDIKTYCKMRIRLFQARYLLLSGGTANVSYHPII